MRSSSFALLGLFLVALPALATWSQVPGGLVQVSVGSSGQVWGVNGNDDIYQYGGGGNWTQIAGKLTNVAVGADGTVWGVNRAGNIYRRDGANWTQIPGGLVQISVGNSSNVWGVNSADEIYRWTGSGWERIAGALKWVGVGSDGAVWGVNRGGQIWQWNGSSWNSINGTLANISVGNASTVWGAASGGEVYKWNGGGWTRMEGTLKQVAVAADGSLWAVNASAGIVTGTVATIATGGSASASGSNVMLTGQILRSANGDYLVSSNKAFVAIMQTDGNFCEYAGSSPTTMQPGAFWCSNVTGAAGAHFSVQMHYTNNFCTTTGDEWGQGPALWCTNQVGSGSGPAFAMLQDDAGFVIRQGTPAAPGTVLWQNGVVRVPPPTSANGKSTMGPNEVLRTGESLVTPGYFLRMRNDLRIEFMSGDPANPGTTQWISDDFHVPTATRGVASLTSHGLCVTPGDDPRMAAPVWCSNPNEMFVPGFVTMSSGRLLVFAGTPQQQGAQFWTASNTVFNSTTPGDWSVASLWFPPQVPEGGSTAVWINHNVTSHAAHKVTSLVVGCGVTLGVFANLAVNGALNICANSSINLASPLTLTAHDLIGGGTIVVSTPLTTVVAVDGNVRASGGLSVHSTFPGSPAYFRLASAGDQTFDVGNSAFDILEIMGTGRVVSHTGNTTITTMLSNSATFISTGTITFRSDTGGVVRVSNYGSMRLQNVVAAPGTTVVLPAGVTVAGTVTGAVTLTK